jgi:hypothetical protein
MVVGDECAEIPDCGGITAGIADIWVRIAIEKSFKTGPFRSCPADILVPVQHARLLRRPFIELSQAEVLHQNISLRRSWISGEKTL